MTHPPAEWAPLARMFTAFPSHEQLWQADLAPARAEVAAMVNALTQAVPVTVLAHGPESVAAARAACPEASVEDIGFGDIWLRDTGPIFLSGTQAARFRFNGWGGKYDLPHDDSVGAHIAGLQGAAVTLHDFVLEGGALEHDGNGLFITTEQCLLNPNRNPGWTRDSAKKALALALGARRLLWLGDGLVADHTDGHVDNLARFVAPGTVAVPMPAGDDDPNAAIFHDAAVRLRAAGLVVVPMLSVGLYEVDGAVVPASYMNWVIANGLVVVPLYGAENDAVAVAALRRLFPRHKVVGLPAMHILTGGGSFHCITQHVPVEGAR